MASEVRGRMSGGQSSVEAARIAASAKSGLYTSLETTVSDGAADTALTALVGGSGFFSPLSASVANWIEIHTDKTISLKFRTRHNSATATASLKSVKIRANTTRTIDWIAEVTEIYVSNSSGGTATFDIQAI